MKLIIGALACVLGFVTAQPNPVNAQGRETVSGRVLSASDSLPLAGVRVRVMGATAQSESDSNGRFVLRGVPLGALRLLFDRLGIAPDTLELAQPGRGIIVYLRPRAVAVRPFVATTALAARRRFENLAQTSTVSLDPIDVAAAPGLAEPDVIQTVQLLPGTVAQSDYSLGFSVRGGRRDQNLVLIDGITVFNPSHMGGLFSMFDPAAVREVDLITGGFPARYGGRLSSVLDVDLRDGNPNSTDVHGLVSLVASKLLVEGPVGRTGVSYMVGARGSYPDAAQRISGAGRIPFRFVDALAKITVPLGTGGRISTTGYWGRDIGTIPWLTAEPGREGVDAEFTLGNRLVGVNFQQPLGAARLEQHLAVSEFRTRLAFVPGIRQFENSIRLLSASTSLAFAPPRHEVRLGVGVETYSMQYTIESEVLETQTLDEFYDPTVWSAFVEDQWRPVAWLLLRPGARIEYVTGAAFTGIAPRVAFKAFASENSAVVGSAGRYYQAVHSMKEEQAPVTEFDFWIGADEVTPVARSDQVVLGLEHWFGSALSLTLEGYTKSFHNVLLRNVSDDPKLHGDEFMAADGSAHGLELVLRRYSGPISGWVAYSFAKSSLRVAGAVGVTGEGGEGRETFPSDHDRRHSLDIVVRAPGPLGSTLGIRWGYGSPLPYTGIVGDWFHRDYNAARHRFDQFEREPLSTAINGQRFPHYARLDIGLRWQFDKWGATWRPYVQVVNAYDRRNVLVYAFDYAATPPTRTGTAQLPFFPTVGVEFEW